MSKTLDDYVDLREREAEYWIEEATWEEFSERAAEQIP